MPPVNAQKQAEHQRSISKEAAARLRWMADQIEAGKTGLIDVKSQNLPNFDDLGMGLTTLAPKGPIELRIVVDMITEADWVKWFM